MLMNRQKHFCQVLTLFGGSYALAKGQVLAAKNSVDLFFNHMLLLIHFLWKSFYIRVGYIITKGIFSKIIFGPYFLPQVCF